MTPEDLNPQAEQMADESMVRNLAAQAEAIWPMEGPLFDRYRVPVDARILDAGCGTGEIASRLAGRFPHATVLGVDIIDEHLDLARARYGSLAPRLGFDNQSIYELDAADGTFDLTVCRHVLHSIPHADRVIAELVRVTRRGGWLHIVPEDYGMLHFAHRDPDPADFWHEVPTAFGKATNTDLFIGRDIFGIFAGLGLEKIAIDYLPVDTLRARDLFADIITAWRDGYSGAIGEHTAVSSDAARRYFDRMIENIRDPRGYAVWMVPVAAARVPPVEADRS